MKPAMLIRLLGRGADPHHHFGGGDKSGDEVSAAESSLLGNGERRRKDGRTRMRSGARLHGTVKLECVRQSSIGQGGHRRLNETSARAQNAALPSRSIRRRVIDDHLAPRQAKPEDYRTDRVTYRIPGSFES